MEKTTPLEAVISGLANVARVLASRHWQRLEQLKSEYKQISRPDFLWHCLLQSFATMGGSYGWRGMIGDKQNYRMLQYDVLAALSHSERSRQVTETCRRARIRMPNKNAQYILGCFDIIEGIGGPEEAKDILLRLKGMDAKIRYLNSIPGIGEKYARNIMMDVYHEDFRESIAVDARIKTLSDALGLSFSDFSSHEAFYLKVARRAGLNGWELDRLIYNFRDEFIALAT